MRPRSGAIAVLGLVLEAAVIAGCLASVLSPVASPTTTPTIAPTPTSTIAPTIATPSAEPTSPPAPTLWSGIPVVVTAPELDMRSRPSLAADRIETLRVGTVVALGGFGPVEGGGLAWYQVIRMCAGGPDGSADPQGSLGADRPCTNQDYGWMPVGNGNDRWVEPADPRCPTVPDLGSLAAILPGERLECLAGEMLELDGAYRNGCCLIAPPHAFDPEWLIGPHSGPFLLWDLSAELAFLELRFPPAVSVPDLGPEQSTSMRVRGRFDDPRASTCSIEFDESVVPQEQAILYCRQQFVVESYAILGPVSPQG